MCSDPRPLTVANQGGLQSLDDTPNLSSPKPPPHQKRHQPPLPHRRRQPRQLLRPLLRQRPNGVGRIDALGRERATYGFFGNTAIDALSLEIAHQPRGTATASRLGGGIIDGEARVVEQPSGAHSIERSVHGPGRVLFLKQPAPQVEPRVGAARERAQRGAMGRLEVGQLLQPLQDQGPNLVADDEVQRRQRVGRQRCKTPPIHFDQPIVWPAWIGGESGENHSSLAALSSSATAPPPPGSTLLTPRCCFTRASTSADISGWSFRYNLAFSRPCPIRSLPYEYQAPDFSMMPASAAISTSSVSWLMPSSNMISNSAWRNGGATLFFTTFTRTWLPITTSRSLTGAMRRMSSRTEA